MSALADAIRAEREQLLAPIAHRLAVLDEIERLAISLNGAAAPADPSPGPTRGQRGVPKTAARVLPARPPATGRGTDGLSEPARAALTKLRTAKTPLSRSEIGASTGVMQTLVRRGLVAAHGDNRGRRYAAADADNAGAGAAPGASLPDDEPETPAPEPQVLGTLNASQSRVLRARILDHLSRRRLKEQSLADHLNVERDHVAEILGKLLLDGLVILEPDGNYWVPA